MMNLLGLVRASQFGAETREEWLCKFVAQETPAEAEGWGIPDPKALDSQNDMSSWK